MYTHKTTIRMHDTDAAGIIFFTSLLRIAHDAFEHLLDEAGLGLGHMLANTDYRIPIVHAEADYHTPLKLGDAVTVVVTSERIGTSSFTLRYSLQHDGKEMGSARTVQVTVDKAWKKRPIPKELRALLEKCLS